MNCKFGFLFFFIILTLSNSNIHSQDLVNVYSLALPSQWVSISNEYISVSMDIKTGRYIMYDVSTEYFPSEIKKSFFPRSFLQYTSPISPEDQRYLPLLGSSTNALNVTTINIDNTPVIFGAENGQWLSAPIIQNDSIIYGWAIGGLEIIQTIAIVTNTETLFPDALLITYDVINKDSITSRQVAARIVLDPNVGDNQVNAFFLPNHDLINNEYFVTLESLPEYWLTSDFTGEVSPSSLKGFVQNQHPIKPSKMYFTTINKALRNIWEYKYSKYTSIHRKDNAVVMFFDNQFVAPNSSIRIASTMVGIPSLINVFGDNGLEIRTSTFTSQQTTPLSVDLWLQNMKAEIFDEVVLEIKVPPTLEVYDSLIKRVDDVGYGNKHPVSWNIASKSKQGNTHDILIDVKGYQNGLITSQFDIPIVINIDDEFIINNTKDLLDTIDKTKTTVQQLTPISKETNILIVSEFNPGDTYGSTSESLSKIYTYLQKNDNVANKQIIKMIETEQVLIQEIVDIESSLLNINKQYDILLGIYERLYKDSSRIDREQINIQNLTDNIGDIEEKLKQQESMVSNMTSNLDQ